MQLLPSHNEQATMLLSINLIKRSVPMSSQKINQVFSSNINDKSVAAMVANALRHEHQNAPSAVKEIGMITNANLHTINKWYQALSAPKSANLLILAIHYPEVLKGLLEMVGKTDIWEIYQREQLSKKSNNKAAIKETKNTIYSDRSVTINVVIKLEIAKKLNHRQLWFIGELQQKKKPKADNIVTQWQVNMRTARRDIKGLLKQKIIHHKGSKKNGFYATTI